MPKILAIDDELDILYTLQAIGEIAGFEVVIAENGLQGLKLIQAVDFDLILVDYHMPQMNGLEVVERIRKIDQDTPILVLTVEESVDLSQKFLDTGATDFAVKPIRTADLISRMKLHLKFAKSKFEDDEKVEPEIVNIDRLDLPKGLTPATLQMIIAYLKNMDQSKTINQISTEIGLSYQTGHRYLDYLQKNNYVKVEMCYGKVGRPIQKYLSLI